jgi:hypothetical protein
MTLLPVLDLLPVKAVGIQHGSMSLDKTKDWQYYQISLLDAKEQMGYS